MSDKRIIRIDAHTLNTVQSCAREAKFSLKDLLVPMVKAEHLEMGILGHYFLAGFYQARKDGLKGKARVDKAIEEGRLKSFELSLEPDKRIEVEKEFFNYCLHVGEDIWEPMEVEAYFAKPLYEDDELMILAEGIIDLVGKNIKDDRPEVIDHKLVWRKSEPFMLSNQFFMYSWATEYQNIVINQFGMQKTLPPNEKFRRLPYSYTQAMIDEWIEWAIYWAKLWVWYQDNGVYPPNYTSCDKFSGCQFRDLCSTTKDTRDWKASVKFKVGKVWDPRSR